MQGEVNHSGPVYLDEVARRGGEPGGRGVDLDRWMPSWHRLSANVSVQASQALARGVDAPRPIRGAAMGTGPRPA